MAKIYTIGLDGVKSARDYNTTGLSGDFNGVSLVGRGYKGPDNDTAGPEVGIKAPDVTSTPTVLSM